MEPSQVTDATYLTILILGVIVFMFDLWKRKKATKHVIIVEDDDGDFDMMKFFLDLSQVTYTRYRTADDIFLPMAAKKPDLVIADYYLAGKIKGDKLVKFCKKFHIPALLITGCVREIDDVPAEDIIRKTGGREWCDNIQVWLNNKLAA